MHPEYLDAKGLVALWREALLAQNVLLDNTKGYKTHPQLDRFKKTSNPDGAIAWYLKSIISEAERRGCNFNRSKIVNKKIKSPMIVTTGQVKYEFNHFLVKLSKRDPDLYKQLKMKDKIRVNPIFKKVRGNVEDWEKIYPS